MTQYQQVTNQHVRSSRRARPRLLADSATAISQLTVIVSKVPCPGATVVGRHTAAFALPLADPAANPLGAAATVTCTLYLCWAALEASQLWHVVVILAGSWFCGAIGTGAAAAIAMLWDGRRDTSSIVHFCTSSIVNFCTNARVPTTKEPHADAAAPAASNLARDAAAPSTGPLGTTP
eukprot:6647158-Prymnesium_polylepis.2